TEVERAQLARPGYSSRQAVSLPREKLLARRLATMTQAQRDTFARLSARTQNIQPRGEKPLARLSEAKRTGLMLLASRRLELEPKVGRTEPASKPKSPITKILEKIRFTQKPTKPEKK
ncbi:MAG: hypothetical protein Q8R15_01725, partial [Candidatus Micrarchaeota archaeon]|nr:hypothetical protein [Candidatus Micrarchaeota archaeon]